MISVDGREVQRSWGSTARRQASDIRTRYGFRAVDVEGLVYVADEDWDALVRRVLLDETLSPIGHGFLLGGNGNTVLAPAWTLDPERIARLRRLARFPRWLRRILAQKEKR